MNAWSRKREGQVSILTLNRPPINTLDRTDLHELAEIVERLEDDDELRVVVITGGIKGIFCCGGDLKYWRNIANAREVSGAGREVFAKIERLSKPTVAAINGHVVGDGLALALACDFRIAAETSVVRLPEVACGFIPGWGLIHRLVAAVGRSHASDLLLTSRRVGAAEARMMGLINEVVPDDRLLNCSLAKASELATLSPDALKAAKWALLGRDEVACFETVWGGRDWRTGIDAILQKRVPVFESNEKRSAGNDFRRGIQEGCASRR